MEKVGDEFKVTRSFYSSARRVKLDYASSVAVNVLEGLTLSASDIEDYTAYGAGYVWKHESAHKYHKPLFEAFMNKYAI